MLGANWIQRRSRRGREVEEEVVEKDQICAGDAERGEVVRISIAPVTQRKRRGIRNAPVTRRREGSKVAKDQDCAGDAEGKRAERVKVERAHRIRYRQ